MLQSSFHLLTLIFHPLKKTIFW